MTDLRKKALAKLGYVECVCVKHDSMNDWYTIERAEHDGRHWLEPVDGGHTLMYSGRIADADVEGDGDEMLSIAKAIEDRTSFGANRCAVRVSGNTVALWSPRNSRNPGHIPLSAADKLAASIRSVVTTKDPSP